MHVKYFYISYEISSYYEDQTLLLKDTAGNINNFDKKGSCIKTQLFTVLFKYELIDVDTTQILRTKCNYSYIHTDT